MKKHVVLTDEQMSRLREAAAFPMTDFLVVVWGELLGEPLEQRADAIAPWEWAVPREQWEGLVKMWMDLHPGGALSGANAVLDFVNIGPSAYDDEGGAS